MKKKVFNVNLVFFQRLFGGKKIYCECFPGNEFVETLKKRLKRFYAKKREKNIP